MPLLCDRRMEVSLWMDSGDEEAPTVLRSTCSDPNHHDGLGHRPLFTSTGRQAVTNESSPAPRWKRVASKILVVTGVALAVFISFLIAPALGSEPDAPSLSWADKLTAIGTVGAVAATLAITLITYFRDRGTRNRDQKDRADALLKQQALQVHWWLEPCTDHPPEWDGEDYGIRWLTSRTLSECWGTRLVIENRSELPIHDANPVMTLKVILQPQFGNWSIGPGGRTTFDLSGEGECLLDMVNAPSPYLLFRDHVGRAWRRNENGTLVRVDDSLNLSDEMISLSGDAYRTINAAYRHEAEGRRQKEEIRAVIGPLVANGLAGTTLELLEPGDAVAFELLQKAHRRGAARRVGEAWWSWRAGRSSADRVEAALNNLV